MLYCLGPQIYLDPTLLAKVYILPEYSNSKLWGRDTVVYFPGWKGPQDAPVLCGNRAVYSAVMPHGTAPNHRFPLSQQYDRQRTEHEGSSSPRAMEPSATGLQQVKALTDATLVQHRNTFVVYFLAFTVGRGRRC